MAMHSISLLLLCLVNLAANALRHNYIAKVPTLAQEAESVPLDDGRKFDYISDSCKVLALYFLAHNPKVANLIGRRIGLSTSRAFLRSTVSGRKYALGHHAPAMCINDDMYSKTFSPNWPSLNMAFRKSIEYNSSASKGKKGLMPKTTEEALAVIARGGGSQILPGVFFLGSRSRDTFGGAGYLIVRESGMSNILIDCAQPTDELVQAVKLLGGATYAIFTHTDDLAGHHVWRDRLGCKRIIHEAEVRTGWNARAERTADIELRLGEKTGSNAWAKSQEGPWVLPDGDDIIIHHTPGHTTGHVTIQLLDKKNDRKVLFTGDHFAVSNKHKILGMGSRYSESYVEQIKSVRNLKALDFEWILPGHGRPYRFPKDDAEARSHLVECGAQNMEDGLLN